MLAKTVILPKSKAGDKDRDIEIIPGCKLIYLPKILDHRGNMTFIEGSRHIPFDIKRVFYLYDVPGGAERAGHAHKDLEQFLIGVSGSLDVVIDNGSKRKRVHLNRSYYGLYLTSMIWRELENFSSGSVCLSLASKYYDQNNYYRDYKEFKSIVKGNHK